MAAVVVVVVIISTLYDVWRVAGKRKKLGLESEGCLLLEQTLKKKTEETHELGVKEEEAGCLHKWMRGRLPP